MGTALGAAGSVPPMGVSDSEKNELTEKSRDPANQSHQNLAKTRKAIHATILDWRQAEGRVSVWVARSGEKIQRLGSRSDTPPWSV